MSNSSVNNSNKRFTIHYVKNYAVVDTDGADDGKCATALLINITGDCANARPQGK
jgi:hypothetical protein